MLNSDNLLSDIFPFEHFDEMNYSVVFYRHVKLGLPLKLGFLPISNSFPDALHKLMKDSIPELAFLRTSLDEL